MADKDFKVKTGLDLPAPLPVEQGGTGQTSAANAINALLPSQTTSGSKILGTDGTNVSWVNPGASTSVTNVFNTNQVIDVSTSVAALRVTQRGTGEAFRVEDDTNPDSTPFVISSSGNVGIGTPSPDSVLHMVSSGDTSINITKSGQSTWFLQSLDSGAFRLYSGTASAERLKIDNTGNVIIGGAGINLTNGKIIINSTSSVTGANWSDAMLHITGINDANSHPGMTFHAPGVSAISLYHTRGWQGISVLGNGGGTDTTAGRPVIRNISISTASPSGGNDGDMWATYV